MQRYRRVHNEPDSKSGWLAEIVSETVNCNEFLWLIVLFNTLYLRVFYTYDAMKVNMQRYRSGYNENDSKSFDG